MTFTTLALLTGFETLFCAALLSYLKGNREGVRFGLTRHSIALTLVSLMAFVQVFARTPALLFCVVVVSIVLQLEGAIVAVSNNALPGSEKAESLSEAETL
ncbi:hypothetical protein [Pseudovibrio sp. Ad26]|uniref:hypothetical protein n=1 Tax=Pseudovibrio sp. Ad26 TaxID=989410 RepID=UPI0007AEE47A|nr:hypothetical protein [Pseudovibrio sp. Ad26]KZL03585.1 hypothetical protein PsAD26_04661 [Pseudovibrio sp. Ad26]